MPLALSSALTGCEGVTIEIVEPSFVDRPSDVVAWELWFIDVAEGECPPPAVLTFEGTPLSLPGTGELAAIEDVALTPGRQAVVAIGRDTLCAPVLYGQTCVGPDAPPRVIMVTTCDVAAERCLEVPWTLADRAALACSEPCDASRCR